VDVPDNGYCSNCGWQIVLYSGKPDKILSIQLQQRCLLKKECYEQYKAFEKAEQEFLLKTKDLEPLHQIQKENYENMLPSFKALTQQLEEVQQNSEFADINDLEQRIQERQRQIDLLFDKIPPKYHHVKIPNVTFLCHYNKLTNQLEIVVDEVLNRFANANLDIFFAVAFFSKPGITFHDADLIVPTESKRIGVFAKGDKINLNLKYQPPLCLLETDHHQVIHLIANSLSEFKIIYGY